MLIKQLKDKICKSESRLGKLMNQAQTIWQETSLDPRDPSYLVEKTMRFEVAQKSITDVFSSFKDLIEDYKKLCQELEKTDE